MAKKKTLNFTDPDLNNYKALGKDLDETNRSILRASLPKNNKKVEASRHTIVSGPPGVGKSYGAFDECKKANINFLQIAPGTSDAAFITKLCYYVYNQVILKKQEGVLLLDDADDKIFDNYKGLNTWKIALGDTDYDLDIIPKYNHQVSMTNTIKSLRNANKNDLADAIEYFIDEDSVGVSVPMDKIRVLVLCNLDLEDPRSFNSSKMRSAVGPVVDRNNYVRIEANKEKQWGWTAYVLEQTQPFGDKGFNLTLAQKKELLNWMWRYWDQLRSTSYRTVEKLAEAMINYPNSYEAQWKLQLKSIKHLGAKK
jgi:hypothetical protein